MAAGNLLPPVELSLGAQMFAHGFEDSASDEEPVLDRLRRIVVKRNGLPLSTVQIQSLSSRDRRELLDFLTRTKNPAHRRVRKMTQITVQLTPSRPSVRLGRLARQLIQLAERDQDAGLSLAKLHPANENGQTRLTNESQLVHSLEDEIDLIEQGRRVRKLRRTLSLAKRLILRPRSGGKQRSLDEDSREKARMIAKELTADLMEIILESEDAPDVSVASGASSSLVQSSESILEKSSSARTSIHTGEKLVSPSAAPDSIHTGEQPDNFTLNIQIPAAKPSASYAEERYLLQNVAAELEAQEGLKKQLLSEPETSANCSAPPLDEVDKILDQNATLVPHDILPNKLANVGNPLVVDELLKEHATPCNATVPDAGENEDRRRAEAVVFEDKLDGVFEDKKRDNVFGDKRHEVFEDKLDGAFEDKKRDKVFGDKRHEVFEDKLDGVFEDTKRDKVFGDKRHEVFGDKRDEVLEKQEEGLGGQETGRGLRG